MLATMGCKISRVASVADISISHQTSLSLIRWFLSILVMSSYYRFRQSPWLTVFFNKGYSKLLCKFERRLNRSLNGFSEGPDKQLARSKKYVYHA